MYVAMSTQNNPVKKDRRNEDRTHGMLFARSYNDKLLLREGQLVTSRKSLVSGKS